MVMGVKSLLSNRLGVMAGNIMRRQCFLISKLAGFQFNRSLTRSLQVQKLATLISLGRGSENLRFGVAFLDDGN